MLEAGELGSLLWDERLARIQSEPQKRSHVAGPSHDAPLLASPQPEAISCRLAGALCAGTELGCQVPS